MNNSQIQDSSSLTGMEVAIIGMAGRFPGAKNTGQFWENLKNGVESITFYTDDQLIEAGVDPDTLENPNYVKGGRGILEGVENFDAAFFGFSAGEAEILDPQVRIFHECAWNALEDAGYDSYSYDGLIGLYAGASYNLFWEALSFVTGRIDTLGLFTSELLIDRDYLCTRVSYNLNLQGPSVIVKSACSTSLVAVHMACQSLINRECDMALAGGVTATRLIPSGYMYQEDMIMSKDGHCRAFDAQASGTVFGDGSAVVVLKSLEDALRDRDHIYALIKGSAINNDGVRKAGYTAPSIQGQADVIAEALQVAEVDPESITYVETHGTGTDVGDPIEIEGLKTAFDTHKKGFCRIGSVKSNVGHLDSAAGAAGLIKTVLALKHRQIPPSLHYQSPNPKIDFQDSPFIVNTGLIPWERENGTPLRAGVSSFGIGGTNAHAILEEAPPVDDHREALPPLRSYHLLTVSANSPDALDRMCRNLGDHFKQNPSTSLSDAAYTLHIGRRDFPHRRISVCADAAEVADAFSSTESGKTRSFHAKEEKRSVIFLFSGLGGEYIEMGLDLYRHEPVFKAEMDRCFSILHNMHGFDLKKILYPSEPSDFPETPEPSGAFHGAGINDIRVNQPLVFSLEYALSKLLMTWGIQPHAMMGYSFGEYTAAALSGVFSPEDALRLIIKRGELLGTLSTGTMMSVPMSRSELEPILPESLSIAIDNGPSCIIAGTTENADAFDAQLKTKRIMAMRLPNSHALHSPMMEPILNRFEVAVAGYTLNKPQIPYISNLTGKWITVQEAQDPNYWCRHIRSTVRFAVGIELLKQEPNPLFIEIGPGRDLKALVVRSREDEKSAHAVNLLRAQQQETPDDRYLMNRIGQLWLYGAEIDWNAFHSNEKNRRIPLPHYSFDASRFWFEGNPLAGDNAMMAQGLPAKKTDCSDWFYVPQWSRSALPSETGVEIPAAGTQWLVFATGSPFSSRLLKELKKAGYAVVSVTPGSCFQPDGDNSFLLNPDNSDDYQRLMTELAARDSLPHYILHLWCFTGKSGTGAKAPHTFDELDRSQTLGLHSLLDIARAVGSVDAANDMILGVVTDNMQPVTGDEELHPEKATVLGPIKVIPLEYPNIKCLGIDIPGTSSLKKTRNIVIDNLLREFSLDIPDFRLAAYRGNFRWTESYEAVHLEESGAFNGKPRLKEKGVYLVTGGFGGMGFALADYLARSHKARLVLVDFWDISLKEGHDPWLNSPERSDDIQAKIQKTKEWQALGAEVDIHNADVSDYDRMAAAIQQAINRFGRIDGVIHAAGLIDYSGVIQRRTRQMTETLLDAKVKGTLVLDKLLEDQSLDFMVLFSSLGNLFHKMKFGQVAYNAGHEFLDVYAYWKRSRGTFATAVDWNDWTDVGMGARAMQQRSASYDGSGSAIDGNSIENILSISPRQGIDVFNRVVSHRLARVVVFSRDLERMLTIMNSPQPNDETGSGLSPGSEPTGDAHQRPELDTPYVEPSDDSQRILAGIWQKIFRIDRVGIQDDFFDLGGDSLLAGIMVSRVREEMGIRVPILEVYNKPTVEKLAGYIRGKGSDRFKGVDEHLVLFKEHEDDVPNLFFIYNGTGEIEAYYDLANNIQTPLNIWGVRSEEIENYAPVNTSFEEFASQSISHIKTLQPNGPYYMAGWCSGGIITFEVVRQMEHMGDEVKFLGLIDSPIPFGKPGAEGDFSFQNELQWLLNGIPGDELKKRAAEVSETKELWPIVVDYLEEVNFDKEIIKGIMPERMPLAYPNLNEMDIRELIYAWNMVRTFDRAEKLYVGEGTVNAPAYCFVATQEDICHPDEWTRHCHTVADAFDVEGDHFTIFSTPNVEPFAKTFDKAIQSALAH